MELTKDITERIYSLIENARSDGKIRKGVNEVTKSLERGEAKLSNLLYYQLIPLILYFS